MHCPYCGDERSDLFKTLFRRSKTYGYRRCRFCKAWFRTEEEPVRWEGVDRKWPSAARTRNDWRSHRGSALRGNCEVQSCSIASTLVNSLSRYE